MSRVRIVAVGDIMPGDSAALVGWGLASRWPGLSIGEVLADVASLIEGDVVFGNLESPLTEAGIGRSKRQRDQMRASPEVARALATCGFNMLSVANNHAMQHGRRGFEDTLRALDEAGIHPVGVAGTDGWGAQPAIAEVGHDRVGILGYCWRPRQYSDEVPGYSESDLDQILLDVSRLRRSCSIALVSMHWGDEFVSTPSKEQRLAADAIVRAGAQIVVGHHPHVVQPQQQLAQGFVAYSLGNFVSDMTWLPQLREGGVLRADLSAEAGVEVSTTIVEQATEYRIRRTDRTIPYLQDPVPDDLVYRKAVAQALRDQQVRLYRHAFKNAWRFRPDVLADLVLGTAKNKLVRLGKGRKS